MSTARVEERIILSMKKNPPQQLDTFCPKGLRVLLVDDNPLCLATMERMLQQCHYNVTICSRLSQAISLLTEKRVTFDIVMSEVCLQEEGGFKLLEIAGLGLDIPVILMSAKGETSVVMRGITHGACDHLIKPIRIEVLRNIWQHVVRRRQRQQYQHCNFNLNDSLEGESSDGVRTIDSAECGSKKRKDQARPQESDTGQRIEDISGLKKARVHWTVQLHQQFVNAVNQLQIDKAVPKKILDIMKVQGLTRENVASHLQKYRIYLRRLSGVIPEPRPVASFQAAGDGKAGGSMQIRQGGRHDQHQDHDDRLSPPSELKALNIGDPGAAISSQRGGGGSGGIDRATLVSLQQYRAYEQRRAAENQAQSSSERGFDIEAGGCLSRKTRKKNCSAINDTATSVETKGVIVDVTRWARLCATKSQSSFPTFTDSTGITTVISQEAKRSEKTSSWNDTEDFFVDKFVHEYELPNLAAAEPAQDFMSTASATAPDISDYLIDDMLTQSK